MNFKRFSILIGMRTALILVNIAALGLSLSLEGYHITSFVVVVLLLSQCYLLVNFVSKTNQELARFLDAARYADYTQKFELSSMGTGFGELGQAFSDILDKFQSVRAQQEQQLKHIKAIVEHVPVPLLSFDDQQQITLWNHAARQLFGSHYVTKIEDLSQFGPDFSQQVADIKVGDKHLVHFNIDGMAHQLSLSATQISLTHKQETLVSLQDIQSELDTAQLLAWQDLVKVLTHEIMNSITPVASLANTTVDLLEDITAKAEVSDQLNEDLKDISEAVETVARRSDGLMQFVGSYRKLTRLPQPNQSLIKVADLIQQNIILGTQGWQDKGITITTEVTPLQLEVSVDKDMLGQVLLNLLKNAEHAVENTDFPQVRLTACLNKRGHVVIEIADNGKGVPKDIIDNIFVPFYTTKPQGSGVGLALSRQIMLAHGGNIKCGNNKKGGAIFTLTF